MLEATQTQIVDAGLSQISSVKASPHLATNLTWRLINDANGATLIAESGDSIVEVDDGRDAGTRRYDRVYTAPSAAGRYLAVWRLFDEEEVAQQIVVAASRDAAFATTDDVATRLGRALTTEETSTALFLLNMAAAVIADAAGYDDGWAVSLSPVPNLLRMLSVELTTRALSNPSQYASIRQQVGSYSFEVSRDAPGMALSDAEELMVRRAVHGRTTDSADLASSFEPAQDEYWLRKQSVRVSDPQNPASVIP